MSRYVRVALAKLREAKGLRLQVTPMATVIEAGSNLDILWAVETATTPGIFSPPRSSPKPCLLANL